MYYYEVQTTIINGCVACPRCSDLVKVTRYPGMNRAECPCGAKINVKEPPRVREFGDPETQREHEEQTKALEEQKKRALERKQAQQAPRQKVGEQSTPHRSRSQKKRLPQESKGGTVTLVVLVVGAVLLLGALGIGWLLWATTTRQPSTTPDLPTVAQLPFSKSELLPSDSELLPALERACVEARKEGKQPFALIVSSQSGASVALEVELNKEGVVKDFSNVHVIRIDGGKWKEKLAKSPFDDDDQGNELPRLYALGADGSPQRLLRGRPLRGASAQTYRKVLGDFFAGRSGGPYRKRLEPNSLDVGEKYISLRPVFLEKPKGDSRLVFVYRATFKGGHALDAEMLRKASFFVMGAGNETRVVFSDSLDRSYLRGEAARDIEHQVQMKEDPDAGKGPALPSGGMGGPGPGAAPRLSPYLVLYLPDKLDFIQENKILTVGTPWREDASPNGSTLTTGQFVWSGAIAEFEKVDDREFRFSKFLTPVCSNASPKE